jgi:hypothetical protein
MRVAGLFAIPQPDNAIATKYMQIIQTFHQQIAQLTELDTNDAPQHFKRYLKATNAVSCDAQIEPYVEIYRRYRKEWLSLIDDARRRGLPWVAQNRTLADAQGAT